MPAVWASNEVGVGVGVGLGGEGGVGKKNGENTRGGGGGKVHIEVVFSMKLVPREAISGIGKLIAYMLQR